MITKINKTSMIVKESKVNTIYYYMLLNVKKNAERIAERNYLSTNVKMSS